MLPGLSRSSNQVLLAFFVAVIAMPRLTSHTDSHFRMAVYLFTGGMIGAAWGRGVHASLKWSDYAIGGFILVAIELWRIIVIY